MDNEQDKKYKELEEKFNALRRENEENSEIVEVFCEYIANHSREIAVYMADLMMKADSAQFELACYKAEAKKRDVAQ